MTTQPQASLFNPKMFAPVKELLTPSALVNPFPWLKTMRETTPVRYDEDRYSWDVFGYDLGLQILQDAETFSSRRMPMSARISQSMVFLDPPRHTQLRNLVNKAFTPRMVTDFMPRITAITNELLSNLGTSGELDIVNDIAVPLPVRVIAEIIGIPEGDHMKFKGWSDTLALTADASTPEAIQAMQEAKRIADSEFNVYLLSLMEKRRQEPQQDMLTLLLEAEIDGERLTDDEVVAFCILLLIAGNETTTNLITHGVRALIDHPEVLVQLRERPELITPFIEEVLRYYSPVPKVDRIAAVDTEIAGHQIKAGQGVSVWLGSMNRDESKFVDGERFVVDRDPNPHLAFGFGIHFCLGAPLARLEAQIALSTLINRVTQMEYAPDLKLEPIFSTLVYGFKKLPIRYQV